MSSILITGANGFIGSELIKYFRASNKNLIPVVRASFNTSSEEFYVIDRLDGATDWSNLLVGCSTVIHLAARVHIASGSGDDSMNLYEDCNLNGTVSLAIQAANAGVQRFIFVSSIKVNGENSVKSFSSSDIPSPEGGYAISKYKAENELRRISEASSMDFVIIRPALIYGPRVKGNFFMLLKIIKMGIPIPFGNIRGNKRSYLGLPNLISFIDFCLTSPTVLNKIFLLSDNHDISTFELITRLYKVLGISSNRIFPVPDCILKFLLRILGFNRILNQVFGNLQINMQETINATGWSPPLSMDDCLKQISAENNQN